MVVSSTILTTKGIALLVGGAVVVAGVVVGGVYYLNGAPKLTVVQRSAVVTVPARGEASAVATCLSHETNINGGFAFASPAYATSSLKIEPRSWQVGAYNPTDAPVTLTAYAVCVNAAVTVESGSRALIPAFSDRADKILGVDTDLTSIKPMKDWHANHRNPSCSPGTTLVGFQFTSGYSLSWKPFAPVPLAALNPEPANQSTVWTNSGTALSHEPHSTATAYIERNTRIRESQQPPEWNYQLDISALCARFAEATLVTASVDVAAGVSADSAVTCPAGKRPVGGGFSFPDHLRFGGDGKAAAFFGDGWLFASTVAPARGEASGQAIKAWYVTGVNQQVAGGLFENSSWWNKGRDYLYHGQPEGGAESFGGRWYVPAARTMVATAVCAKIDATPVAPPKSPEPNTIIVGPFLPPVIDLTPAATEPNTVVASPPTASGPTPTPTRTGPAPPPTQTTAPPAEPTKPTVSIQSPSSGSEVCQNSTTQMLGTATRRPGNEAITDGQHTTWEIGPGPAGPVSLGTGAAIVVNSGQLANLPNGPQFSYTVTFTATDPVNGLTNSAGVTITLKFCQ